MPIIKSAKKRVRVAEKAAIRNSKTKRSLKSAVKAFHKAVTGGEKDLAKLQRSAESALDKAGKKNVLHKNKVARKKSQLARAAKAAGVSTASKSAKKPTAKSSTAKSAVKKPAAKKSAK